MFTFVVPGVSYAHSLPSQPHSQSVFTANVINHGHKQTFNMAFGQEKVILTKNGGSIYIKMDFTPVTIHSVINRNTVTPKNGSVPIFECGNATGTATYKSAAGITVITYTLKDFFCNNGVAVTAQNPPTDSWSTAIGTTLTSHSTTTGWIQKPWSAYAIGSYNFLFGIPTPWGGIGDNCGGSLQINMLGDGPFLDYYNNCD